MTDSRENGPRWAARLATLCQELRQTAEDSQRSTDERARNANWEEAWVLLCAALGRYLRLHAARLGRVSAEDLEDLVAAKPLDLVGRAVSGAWDTTGRSVGEVAAFLSTVARNEVIDWRRRMDRFVPLSDGPSEEAGHGEEAQDISRWVQSAATEGTDDQAPDLLVERREFASALVECAEALESRARNVWFFRTFLGMRSREIAAHPSVGARIGHVDVLFSRSRKSISECMKRKGHSVDTMPSGIFLELWSRFREAGAMSQLAPGLAETDGAALEAESTGDKP